MEGYDVLTNGTKKESVKKSTPSRRNDVAFWLLGLINNSSYVIMMAGAVEIVNGGIGLVFLADVLPSFMVKISAPYWFHLVPYAYRLVGASILMALSFIIVGVGKTPAVQLLGVALSALQSGLGEASFLALASFYDSRRVLTTWSSGTGFAGVFGYAWVFLFHLELRWSFAATLQAALILPIFWLCTFFFVLEYPRSSSRRRRSNVVVNDVQFVRIRGGGGNSRGVSNYGGWWQTLPPSSPYSHTTLGAEEDEDGDDEGKEGGLGEEGSISHQTGIWSTSVYDDDRAYVDDAAADDDDDDDDDEDDPHPEGRDDRRLYGDDNSNSNSTSRHTGMEMFTGDRPHASSANATRKQHLAAPPPPLPSLSSSSQWTSKDRFLLVCSLWPFIVPLLIVYAAEYTQQTGVWGAIGFPVTSEDARKKFYTQANWTYQAGVFISRSSGMLFRANMSTLWIMPILQFILLLFFYHDAVHHFIYNHVFFLCLCFVAGLLGGAVYVNAFTLIAHTVIPQHREFALAAASVGDSIGIVLSDTFGLFVQACVYKANDVSGAVVTCPWR